MKFINSIKEIESYDYFIFDIWGVIHDGMAAYPDAVKSVQYIRSLGKKICFVSNAPRRHFIVEQVLKKFGITEDLYDFVISSGEAVFLDLKNNQENGFTKYGQKYFYLGPDKDLDLLSQLDYIMVKDIKEASFVLTTGFDHDEQQIAEKIDILQQALDLKLPMICANPDLKVVRQNGHEMNCAGLIGETYEEMGGKVDYYGKPHLSIYKITCNLFKSDEKSKIIAIGDGLDTDIKGANIHNIDSLLVTGGLLSNILEIKFWQDCDQQQLKNICSENKTFPDFVISNLKL